MQTLRGAGVEADAADGEHPGVADRSGASDGSETVDAAGTARGPSEHSSAGEPVLGTLSRWPKRAEHNALTAELGAAPFAALAVVPDRHAAGRRRSRLGRTFLRVVAGPRRALARRAARRLSRAVGHAGLHVVRSPIEDTAHGLALGDGPRMFKRRASAPGSLVTGRRRAVEPSYLDVARAAAAAAAGTELTQSSVTVLRTGALMAELSDPFGGRYLLRVAGGHAADLLETALGNRRALLASGPAAVSSRVPVSLGAGFAGDGAWTLEPKIGGAPTEGLTPALWRECLDFLVGLHATPQPRDGGSLGTPAWDIGPEFRAIEPHLDDGAREALNGIEAELAAQLAGLPSGWAHGDFWGGNLLIADHRLQAVLDWDSAAPGAPPALDLMHLSLLSDRRARRLPHGSRCLDVLWPLAQREGDEHLRYYCGATGCPTDPTTLTGLSIAYWALRVGRDLRTYQDRPSRPDWMEDNLHRPLRELQRAGW